MNSANIRNSVRAFYEDIWNRHDNSVLASLLASEFTFRGSLGRTCQGHAAFADYVRMVHQALGDYGKRPYWRICLNKHCVNTNHSRWQRLAALAATASTASIPCVQRAASAFNCFKNCVRKLAVTPLKVMNSLARI